MNHHIYLYGSITMGDIHQDSDADILVITKNRIDFTEQDYPKSWSSYTISKIIELHQAGSLFSWHLYKNAICVFSPDQRDPIKELGKPGKYNDLENDYLMFRKILQDSINEIQSGSTCSLVYEIGLVYMSIRDIGMHLSYHLLNNPIFSKYVAYLIDENFEKIIPREIFNLMIKCRSASMRGTTPPSPTDLIRVSTFLDNSLINWSDNHFSKARENVQTN